MAYRLTERADADLREIDDFISERMENPQGAEVVEAYLFEAFERIGRNPKRCVGKSRREITSRPVKFLTVRKYVVIYDDRTDPVLILRVAGGRQDLARLLNPSRKPRK